MNGRVASTSKYSVLLTFRHHAGGAIRAFPIEVCDGRVRPTKILVRTSLAIVEFTRSGK